MVVHRPAEVGFEGLIQDGSALRSVHGGFELDVLECPRCGGHMRILAAINPAEATHKILDCLGLPSRPPPGDDEADRLLRRPYRKPWIHPEVKSV